MVRASVSGCCQDNGWRENVFFFKTTCSLFLVLFSGDLCPSTIRNVSPSISYMISTMQLLSSTPLPGLLAPCHNPQAIPYTPRVFLRLLAALQEPNRMLNAEEERLLLPNLNASDPQGLLVTFFARLSLSGFHQVLLRWFRVTEQQVSHCLFCQVPDVHSPEDGCYYILRYHRHESVYDFVSALIYAQRRETRAAVKCNGCGVMSDKTVHTNLYFNGEYLIIRVADLRGCQPEQDIVAPPLFTWQKRTFELESIIVCRGDDSTSGHYVAYRRERTVWFELDDEVSRPVKFAEIPRQDAIMLLFKVCSTVTIMSPPHRHHLTPFNENGPRHT